MLRKLRNGFLYLVFLASSTLLLLELCYRWYVVDFYGAQFQALNQKELEETGDRPSILVVGDSFSADQNSYVKGLRNQIGSHRIINAAIPGTCVRQHERYFAKRVRDFQPDLVIYQTYLGNDLLEYRHPTTGGNLSWQRKAYWWLADRFLVLGYINARLPALRHTFAPSQVIDYEGKARQSFDPSTYSERTKMLLKAEPSLLENSIRMQGLRQHDAEDLMTDIKKLLSQLPEDVRVVVLVIPHCVQTGPTYVSRMKQLGANIEDEAGITAISYPFFEYLEKNLSDQRTSLVNSLTWLQEENTVPLYYPSDPHLNTAGQQILADSLLPLVQQLIPIK